MSTDFLFVKPTFVRGVASIANIGGTMLVNNSESPEEADEKAILSDWTVVGDDIRSSMDECRQ